MGSGAAAIDSDAQAFITAAAITDSTQQTAINTLVTDLKGYNIWSKMKAIYPFVGGSASTHKWNLKDPRDLDAAYRLVFVNGWTHSSTGALPNGTDAYADTKLGANLLQTNNHLAYYSKSTNANVEVEIGSYNNLPSAIIAQLRAAGNYISGQNLSAVSFTTTSSGIGFWVGTKRSDTDREVYLNGVSESSVSTSDNSVLDTYNMFLGARNAGGTAQLFSSKQTAFASIGDGLTDTEVSNYRTAVNTFNTTLSR